LSKTRERIEKQQQQVHRMEASLAKLKLKERKADTRRKIQLGGLVIKANIADEAAAVILGILIDAAQEMGANEQLKENYRAIGDAAFKEDT
jgi:hypothetical protein